MTLLTALFGRIWGWIAAALGVLAFLKYRESQARKDERDEIRMQQAAIDLEAERRRRASDEAVRNDGADAARRKLRDRLGK